jgi:hypothetical protein
MHVRQLRLRYSKAALRPATLAEPDLCPALPNCSIRIPRGRKG